MNHTNFLEISLLSCLLLPLGSIDCIKFFEKVLSILLAMCLFVNHLEVLCCYQFSFLFFFPLHYKNRILSADFHVLTFNCYAMIDIKAMQGKKKFFSTLTVKKGWYLWSVPHISFSHATEFSAFFLLFFFFFLFPRRKLVKEDKVIFKIFFFLSQIILIIILHCYNSKTLWLFFE